MSLYAENVTIYCASKDAGTVSAALNADLQRTATWIEANRLRMNISKTQLITLGERSKKSDINVSLMVQQLPRLTQSPLTTT